jgi:hypothetical protein
MTYGLIFWDNSYNSNAVFKLHRGLLEFWWGLVIGHAENISEN